MKFNRSAFMLTVALLAFAAPMASAQVPSIGVVAPAMRPTYSIATAITPASSATDLLTITGSATRVLRISRVACSGTATAAGGAVLGLVKRSTANVGGTSTPVNTVPHDANDSAASATVRNYTVNVATPGTLVGTLRASNMVLATAATPGGADRLVWDFGSTFRTDEALTLRGTGQVLAINGGGVTLPSGTSLNCDMEWNEQ